MEGYETPPVAGPGPIGQLAAIAVGAWTDIVDIIAPASAAYGDRVNVEVKIRNLATFGIYIAPTGRYNGVDLAFSPEYAAVGAGETHSFTTWFTMPNHDVRVYVWSFYWVEPDWYQDDYGYVDIALEAVPEPQFRGFGVTEYVTV